MPTLTSEGALTIDLVCPRVTFGRRLYALGGGSGTEGRERERGTEGGEREREKRKDRGPSPVHSMTERAKRRVADDVSEARILGKSLKQSFAVTWDC